VSPKPGLADIQVLFGQARAALLQHPGVISVGVGFRQRNGKRTNEPCFVVTVKKGAARGKHPLPERLLGVRVDVQVGRPPKLLASAAGAGNCRAKDRDEHGQIGMVARSGTDRFALTALHVLAREAVGQDAGAGDLKDLVIEGRLSGEQFARIGQLDKGGFDARRDIALVKLDANVDVDDKLQGTSTVLGAPLPLSTNIIGAEVRVEVLSAPTIKGRLQEWPLSGNFDTESGPASFDGLAKFSLATPNVRPGWSGAVVFATTLEPLALISFASKADPAQGIPSFAYGFPLAPHWEVWGLSTL